MLRQRRIIPLAQISHQALDLTGKGGFKVFPAWQSRDESRNRKQTRNQTVESAKEGGTSFEAGSAICADSVKISGPAEISSKSAENRAGTII
jgi:hypothetical protein